jgi:hypothetical protein
MRTLLILTCEHDAALVKRLLDRLASLSAWRNFSVLHLHLDRNVRVATEEALRRAAPSGEVDVRVIRAGSAECWNTRRAETMLHIYKTACVDGHDIVRLDPDVFVASPRFVEAVCGPYHGIGGKLMRLHLPALIAGRQLDFIQGGVSCWGKEGRAFLKALEYKDIDYFRRRYADQIACMAEEHVAQYAYYFNRTEDVILTGALAILAGLHRANIEGLQASPYDVVRNHRSPHWVYEDFIAAYERSGALAYHFEGGHSGRRAQMTEMLHRYYDQVSIASETSLPN